MKIVNVDITKLNPAEYNPRKLSEKQCEDIKKSIEKFGFVDPVIVNKDNTIIGGHQRVKVAGMIGLTEVPVYYVDLNKQDEKELNVRLNRNTGEFDFDILRDEFEIPDLIEWGFSEDEFDITELEPEETVGDDDVPEQVPSITVKGDLYELGEHRVLCGDSTLIDDVEKLMDGEKADMVFTDPPYELKTAGGGMLKNSNSMKQVKYNNVDSFEPDVLDMHAKTCVFFHNKPLIKKYIELSEKWNKPYDLAIYHKQNTIPNYKGHLMTDVEYIAIIGKQDPNKGFEKSCYSKLYSGNKDSDNTLSYSKPIDICVKYIKLYSDSFVFDMFLGSGSTLIACEKTNRKCYGMELNEYYCDVIVKRYVDFCKNNNKPYSVLRNGIECKEFE